MKYSLQLIADAATEPLTIDEAKHHLRVDGTDDDTYIGSMITAARKVVELEIGRDLGEHTREVGFPYFQCIMEFPRPPFREIVSIKYTTYEGVEQTLEDLSVSNPVPCGRYLLDTSTEPGLLTLKVNNQWPSDMLAPGFPVRVRYKCGLVDIPENLKQAMLLLIGHWYENREAVTLGSNNQGFELPMAVKSLCAPNVYAEFV